LVEFESCWKDSTSRFEAIPGKEALGAINHILQSEYGVSLTATAILDAMRTSDIASEMQQIIRDLSKFALSKVP